MSDQHKNNISKSLKGRKINWITKSKKNSDKDSSF
jgi:hypothetical protein